MKFEILGPNNNVVNVVETEANPIRIGKNASCELCLDDASVSRVHAVIELTPQGYRLSDRISVGGTFLNDQRVESSKPAMISSGAVLRFGNVSVRVVFDEVAEEESGGATLAVNAPDLETMASQEVAPSVEAAPRPSLSMACRGGRWRCRWCGGCRAQARWVCRRWFHCRIEQCQCSSHDYSQKETRCQFRTPFHVESRQDEFVRARSRLCLAR